MRSDKLGAYRLRSSGKSYNEITKVLGVPKSTLSGWFTGLELSDKATSRLRRRVHSASLRGLIKRNTNQRILAEIRAKESRGIGEKMIGKISKRDLLLLGASLYWAEGYKRPVMRNGKPKTFHRVSLTNSDPGLIYIFIRFLKEICKIPDEKIKIWIRYFDHQDPVYLMDFWQKSCKIPYSNFQKSLQTASISSQRKKSYNSLPFGVAQISVNSTNLYHRIMGLISGITKI